MKPLSPCTESGIGHKISSVTADMIALPIREKKSHKGDYGKLLIIAGCIGYTGAPILAAQGAIRGGIGLVYLGVPDAIYNITAVKSLEAMPFPLSSDTQGRLSEQALPHILERLTQIDACLIGPGLGRSDALTHIITTVIERSCIPLIIDADGINALSGNIDILDRASCPIVLTPHEGEFMRIAGEIIPDRLTAAANFATAHHCICVLKGHETITAYPNGILYLNTSGNPGMAVGGSGDVLAGLISALICQMPLEQAVPAAVYIHGRAGDIAASKFSQYSMTPTDILNVLPNVFLELSPRV